MNAVGIDVSKGKSMIAVMRPFGEVVASPFEISHTERELKELTRSLKSPSGETGPLPSRCGRCHVLHRLCLLCAFLQSINLFILTIDFWQVSLISHLPTFFIVHQ